MAALNHELVRDRVLGLLEGLPSQSYSGRNFARDLKVVDPELTVGADFLKEELLLRCSPLTSLFYYIGPHCFFMDIDRSRFTWRAFAQLVG